MAVLVLVAVRVLVAVPVGVLVLVLVGVLVLVAVVSPPVDTLVYAISLSPAPTVIVITPLARSLPTTCGCAPPVIAIGSMLLTWKLLPVGGGVCASAITTCAPTGYTKYSLGLVGLVQPGSGACALTAGSASGLWPERVNWKYCPIRSALPATLHTLTTACAVGLGAGEALPVAVLVGLLVVVAVGV